MTNVVKSFAVALIFLAFGISQAFAEKINFAFSSISGSQTPLWIAKEQGFFNKHGLDVQLIFITGGRVVVQTLLAGDLQLGISAPGAVIRSDLAGGDLVFVAVASSTPGFALVSRKEITRVEQLRGKRIGIGQFGGGPDYTTRIVLEKYGLKPEEDVRVVQMLTNPPGRVAALQSGSIDAVVISPPLTLQAKKMGFNLLLDYSTVLPQFFSSGIVTTRKFIREKPKIVENSVKAPLDSMRYIFSHEEGTVELMSRYLKIKDRDFLREYYREVLVKELNRDLYPHLDAVKFALELEKKTNPAAAKAKPEEFVDTSFLDKLKREQY
jgi:NitT/TauT family transport system substrate-binding protein